MNFRFFSQMSRLKKKLLLYFLLISIVSISVSAEIILEVSSDRLVNDIAAGFTKEIESKISKDAAHEIAGKIDTSSVFEPIYDLRNRMILFLIFVTASIIISFVLFTKDIVSPMDDIVDATKKIVDGDLTITVPVMTEDEIGLIASLINDMNNNLTAMIHQVRHEINRHKNEITIANNKINDIIMNYTSKEILENKKIKLSDFKTMINMNRDVANTLKNMVNDLSYLQTFLGMYKIYKLKSDVTQKEIDAAVEGFNKK